MQRDLHAARCHLSGPVWIDRFGLKRIVNVSFDEEEEEPPVTAWVVNFSSSGTAPEGETIPDISFNLSTEGEGVFQELVIDFLEEGEGAFNSTYRIINKEWHIAFATEVQITVTPPPSPPEFGDTGATATILPGIYADGVVVADESLAFALSAACPSDGTNATTPNEPPTGEHPTGVTISGPAAELLWVTGDNPRLLPP